MQSGGLLISRHKLLLLVVLVFCYAIVWVAFDGEPEITATFFLTGAGAIAVAISIAQRLPFPSWSATIALFYLIMMFFLPLVQQLTGAEDFVSMQGVIPALAYTFLGMSAFGLGIFALLGSVRSQGTPITERWPLSAANSIPGAWLLFVIGLAAQIWSIHFGYFGLVTADIERQGTISGLMASLTILVDASTLIAWHLYWERQTNRAALVLGCVAVAGLIYGGLLGNSKWLLIKPFVYIALAYGAAHKTLTLRSIVYVTLAYVFLAYPFITGLRNVTAVAGTTGDLISDIAQLWTLDWFGDQFNQSRADTEAFSSLGRSLLVVLARIVDMTGSEVPFFDGKSLEMGVGTLIPRVLWPEKPDLNIGNLVGQEYGFLYQFDTVTNVSPTQIGELFMNFGLLGVVIGMFLWGVLAAWVDRVIIVSRFSWLASLFVPFALWHESALAHSLIAFVKTIPLLAIAFVFVATVFPPRRERGAGLRIQLPPLDRRS